MNVPNFLTGLRLAAVPVFVALFLSGRLAAALFVFVGAMITDWLDGIAARMLKQFTAIGAILDPVADKLLGLSAVVLLCLTRRLPLWATNTATKAVKPRLTTTSQRVQLRSLWASSTVKVGTR